MSKLILTIHAPKLKQTSRYLKFNEIVCENWNMCEAVAEPKKIKTSQDTNNIPINCAYYVKRKHRFCKMTVAKGKRYCGEHEPNSPTDLEVLDDKEARIPCPLDSKHTIYKWKLRKHLLICNARALENPPAYIVRGVNSGDLSDYETNDKYICTRLSDVKEEEIIKIVEVVTSLYKRFVENQIVNLQSQHPALKAELEKTNYGKNSQKHLSQTSSLLGILEKQNLIDNDTAFIEFGAGKGQLAFHLAQILNTKQNSKVILLDRMSLRHKKDNKIEDKSLVHRIRVDIADFKMSQLDLLQTTKHIVCISKHLCGAATDLTLRCITQQTDITIPSVSGILIAKCCHHRCEWKSFVGKKFLKSNGLGYREFAIIIKMASWAICGTGMSRERRKEIEEQSHNPSETMNKTPNVPRMTLKERERIGLMCKRVLDFSRLEYLREKNFNAELKFYVSSDVTLENVCLLATKIK